MDNQKSYYAILPAPVRYDKRLTPNAKLLYAEVSALCNEKGYCWASNRYFSELYQVSTTSVSKWISSLIELGYLYSVIKYKEGTKEIMHRYLSLVKDPIEENLNTPITKVKDPIEENLNTPIEENLKDNITVINNKDNNTINNSSLKEVLEYFKKVCTDLPSPRGLPETRKKKIKARLKENGMEEVRRVLDEVASSDFLCGRGTAAWKANIDWIFEPRNFVKIQEGNYTNLNSGKKEEVLSYDERMKRAYKEARENGSTVKL